MATENESNSSGYMTRSKNFTPKIQHDLDNRIFFIKLDGTSKAYLSYTKCDSIIQMEHTEVPKLYGGKGLGKLLAQVTSLITPVHLHLNDNTTIYYFFLNL